MYSCVWVLNATFICSSGTVSGQWEGIDYNILAGLAPLLLYRFMLYHLIFVWDQNIAQGDGLRVCKTSRLTPDLPRNHTAWGGERRKWESVGRQTQQNLSGWPAGAPKLNMSGWLGNREGKKSSHKRRSASRAINVQHGRSLKAHITTLKIIM